MKKTLTWVTILVVSVVLTACGANAKASTSAQTTPAPNGTPQAPNQRTLPVALKLALGTFKLDKTNTPITAEQATNMITLWKALKALEASDTTAPEELQA